MWPAVDPCCTYALDPLPPGIGCRPLCYPIQDKRLKYEGMTVRPKPIQ